MFFRQIIEDPQKPISYPSGDNGKPGRLELKLVYGKKIASHRELIAAGTLATAVILEFLLFILGCMQKLDFLSFKLISIMPILLCSAYSIFVWWGNLSESLRFLNDILFLVETIFYIINMLATNLVPYTISGFLTDDGISWPSNIPKILNLPIYEASLAQ